MGQLLSGQIDKNFTDPNKSLACEPGSSLIVTGCGTVGLSAIMAGKIQGCESIIAIEPVEARRKLALELGATHVIDPIEHEDFEEAVRKIVPAGVDYAVDTTGRPDTLQNLTRCFTTQGTLAVVGMPKSLDDDVSFSGCLLYTSPSPRDQRGSRMPSSA